MSNLEQFIGGGGLPVGATLPLSREEDVVMFNGQTWLKSGVVEADPNKYPAFPYTGSMFTDGILRCYLTGKTAGSNLTSPRAAYVSPNGVNVYTLDYDTRSVYQQTLSGVNDITTISPLVPTIASYAPLELQIVSGYNRPITGVSFSPDRTKMYILRYNNHVVLQYTLSTAGDVTTAVYSGKTFDTVNQTEYPRAFAFSSDGTKMYVASYHDVVFQYSLSTAWDITTAVYSNKELSVTGQSVRTLRIKFSSDGTKMYVEGENKVFQYSLSTAWDITTAVYSNKELSIPAIYVSFSLDGTKMYASENNRVRQYSLSTAWDITTAVYSNKEFYVSTTSRPELSSDGLTLYTNSESTVRQYPLSSAWNICSASVGGFSVGCQAPNPTGLSFSTDGTKMYVADGLTDSVFQYSLTTAWNTTTAVYSNKLCSVAGQTQGLGGISFSPDGTKMYALGNDAQYVVYQYSLSTAWDVSTAAYSNLSFVLTLRGPTSANSNISVYGFTFSPGGDRMFVCVGENAWDSYIDGVHCYKLTTPWNVTTASNLTKLTTSRLPRGQGSLSNKSVAFSAAGDVMYLLTSNSQIRQYKHCAGMPTYCEDENTWVPIYVRVA